MYMFIPSIQMKIFSLYGGDVRTQNVNDMVVDAMKKPYAGKSLAVTRDRDLRSDDNALSAWHQHSELYHWRQIGVAGCPFGGD